MFICIGRYKSVKYFSVLVNSKCDKILTKCLINGPKTENQYTVGGKIAAENSCAFSVSH